MWKVYENNVLIFDHPGGSTRPSLTAKGLEYPDETSANLYLSGKHEHSIHLRGDCVGNLPVNETVNYHLILDFTGGYSVYTAKVIP